MIIVVEGVSAAGKTTRAAKYAPGVVHEVSAVPTKGTKAEVGRFWTNLHAERWQRSLVLEQLHGSVCVDTDPMKVHYEWCLWQIGQGDRELWQATVAATRQAVSAQHLGFADQVLLLEPDERTARAQMVADAGRRRSRFDLHLKLAAPLRRWYELLDRLSPGRVIFGAERVEIPNATLRSDRYNVHLFDALIAAADRPAA